MDPSPVRDVEEDVGIKEKEPFISEKSSLILFLGKDCLMGLVGFLTRGGVDSSLGLAKLAELNFREEV